MNGKNLRSKLCDSTKYIKRLGHNSNLLGLHCSLCSWRTVAHLHVTNLSPSQQRNGPGQLSKGWSAVTGRMFLRSLKQKLCLAFCFWWQKGKPTFFDCWFMLFFIRVRFIFLEYPNFLLMAISSYVLLTNLLTSESARWNSKGLVHHLGMSDQRSCCIAPWIPYDGRPMFELQDVKPSPTPECEVPVEPHGLPCLNWKTSVEDTVMGIAAVPRQKGPGNHQLAKPLLHCTNGMSFMKNICRSKLEGVDMSSPFTVIPNCKLNGPHFSPQNDANTKLVT